MSEILEMVVHDVGAANFIPDHLLDPNMHFFHFDPDERGLDNLKAFYQQKKFKPMSANFYNYALDE